MFNPRHQLLLYVLSKYDLSSSSLGLLSFARSFPKSLFLCPPLSNASFILALYSLSALLFPNLFACSITYILKEASYDRFLRIAVVSAILHITRALYYVHASSTWLACAKYKSRGYRRELCGVYLREALFKGGVLFRKYGMVRSRVGLSRSTA